MKSVHNGDIFTDASVGFPVCSRCRSSSSITVSPGAKRFVLWALQTPLHLAEKVRMKVETLNQIRHMIEHLFLSHFQRIPDSWHQMRNLLDYSTFAHEG
jgi:hypothetical protein